MCSTKHFVQPVGCLCMTTKPSELGGQKASASGKMPLSETHSTGSDTISNRWQTMYGTTQSYEHEH